MNQNRNQNRRRGRGSNRGGQGGGQGNRIDSRARGNAPQMLEKYKKLAHDASLNGDRVLTEYYLQFADHYFRVVADSRQQRDDQRPRREYDRDQPFGADDYESEEREEGGRAESQRGEQPLRRERFDEERPAAEGGQRASEGEQVDETVAEENPFIREARPPKARSSQRSRGRGRPANDAHEDADAENDGGTFDATVLPPSIAREPRDEEGAPRPARGRGRRARPADDEGDEALEAVS